MTTETGTQRMPFVIAWREAFSIHVPQVDAEHRHLFRLVAALNADNADATIEELLDYVAVHFTNEQALMEQHGYPEYRAHLGLHEAFAQQVADLLASDDGWSEARVHALRSFLNKWLIGHIMTHDLRFGNWLAATRGHAPLPAAQPPQPAQPKPAGFLARLFGRAG